MLTFAIATKNKSLEITQTTKINTLNAFLSHSVVAAVAVVVACAKQNEIVKNKREELKIEVCIHD